MSSHRQPTRGGNSSLRIGLRVNNFSPHCMGLGSEALRDEVQRKGKLEQEKVTDTFPSVCHHPHNSFCIPSRVSELGPVQYISMLQNITQEKNRVEGVKWI
jgi:hypothetical protein